MGKLRSFDFDLNHPSSKSTELLIVHRMPFNYTAQWTRLHFPNLDPIFLALYVGLPYSLLLKH